jgi:hypothetical protein
MLKPRTDLAVEDRTPEFVNERIRERTRARVNSLADAPDDALRERLYDLDTEWDVARAVEAHAGLAVIGTLLLGKLVDKRFYALTGAVGALLVNFSLSRWWPPISVFRRLGFRTPREIDQERCALEAALRSRVAAELDESGMNAPPDDA